MFGNVVQGWLTLLILIGLLAIPGCSGCRRDNAPDAPEDEEAKEDFTSSELAILPHDATNDAYGLKPGHWFSVSQRLKSNRDDFYGELAGFAGGKSRSSVPIQQTPFHVLGRRPVVLPKGQTKSFELSFFVPNQRRRSNQIWLYSDLVSAYQGTPVYTQPQVVNRLQAYQNYFVVLSERPDAYGYLKSMESINPPSDIISMQPVRGDYVPVLPTNNRQVPLPSFPLMWTPIAYVLWDDFEPTALSPLQQRAMIDWLHWGGQLILSGPSSIDTLRSSFLADYLPADPGERRPMTSETLDQLDDSWSKSTRQEIDPKVPRPEGTTTEIVDLKLKPEAWFVPKTGQMLAERRVGRGRILLSSFSLTSRQFLTWRCFDNFFNGAVLRRPSRIFSYTEENGVTNRWTSGVELALRRAPARETSTYLMELSPDDAMAADFPDMRVSNESFVTSRLRYFSRDAAFSRRDEEAALPSGFDIEGYRCDAISGVAAWTDFSDCSQLAREALAAQAGITVPERSFIVYALGLYLLALVPINWIVFKLIGRVEWAWAAIPLISIAGTFAVVKLAQLDIGFARSRTEIAVLETQPNCASGHLTRYIGLYTSLSTNYVLSYGDDSALALPFSTGTSINELRRMQRQDIYLERVDREKAKVHLGGLAVRSNSTGMVHSEQMLPMSGDIEYDERESGLIQVANNSEFDFRDVGIIRRRRGRLEYAAVGLFKAGSSKRIQFVRVPDSQENVAESWQSFGETAETDAFDFRRFLSLAAIRSRINEGDVRLIGWSEEMLPGLQITPAASQRKSRTLLVANVKYGDLPRPQSDEKLRHDARPPEDD